MTDALMAALAIAVVMGLGAAVPVLAQDGEGKVGTQVVAVSPCLTASTRS
jgi:hypothetical protein